MSYLKEQVAAEIYNYFVWIPVFIGIGIIIFFSLNTEPDLYFCIGSTLVLAALCLFRIKAISILLLISLGFTAAAVRTEYIRAPVIKEKMDGIWFEADVAEIIFADSGRKIVLENIYSDYFLKAETPYKIRISTKQKDLDLEIGDRIVVKAVLMPPPNPAIPNGFDFAQYAYFKQIGAIGYAVGRFKILEYGETTSINKIRNIIAEKIEAHMQQPESSIAIGMLIGDATRIPDDAYEAIRISGIAHIIAISGMHIVIVVVIIFFIARNILVRFNNLALNYNIKKIAAGIAIVGTFLYLLISGSPVSAQRAFIMSTLVLTATCIDRFSNPMRTIAIAAIILLLATPEAILTASLQMSFAACIALIAAFDASQRFLLHDQKNLSYFKKVYRYFISILFSTLVAGTATAPFVIYHFHQYSTYSILTNLIAIPLADFVIMPLGILSLVLMPLGMEVIALEPMELGIKVMFEYANFISTLPLASIFVPEFTTPGFGMIILGSLILCLSITKLRYLGIPLAVLGFITLLDYQKPDIIVDGNAKIFAVKGEKDEFYLSSKVKARFSGKVWLEAHGDSEAKSLKDLNAEKCDRDSCLYVKNNYKVLIANNTSNYNCEGIDLFVNLTQDLNCANAVKSIDRNFLQKHGTTQIYLSGTQPKISSVFATTEKRAWRNNG